MNTLLHSDTAPTRDDGFVGNGYQIEFTDRWPTLEEFERDYIAYALQKSNGNKTTAALLLGLDRRSLYRRLEKFEPAAPKPIDREPNE